MERPNTIAGLQAKRAELAKLYKHLTAEAKNVLCDLDHIDATIRLFDPDADLERIRLNRYATKHRAPKGQMKRFILNEFRIATAPLSTGDITRAWIEDRGLKPDEATFVILRRRITSSLAPIRQAGIIEHAGDEGCSKLWRLTE